MGLRTSVKLWSYYSGSERCALKLNMQFLRKFPVGQFLVPAALNVRETSEMRIRTSIMARAVLGLPVADSRWHSISTLLPRIAEYQEKHLPDYMSATKDTIQRTEKRSAIRMISTFFGTIGAAILFLNLRHKPADIFTIATYGSLGMFIKNFWDIKQFEKSHNLYNFLLLRSDQDEINITPDIIKKMDGMLR